MVWKRYDGNIISNDILKEVESTLLTEKAKGFNTYICIGTDSQVTSGITEFATVIVFVREKAGGFMFISKERTKFNYSLKERMIAEVSKSVEVAYSLQPVLTNLKTRLEVHADINSDPSHKSHTAFTEAMGYIKGMGYDFKAKPDAFASSYCADKVI